MNKFSQQVTVDDAIQTLKQCLRENNQDSIRSVIENLVSNVQSPDISLALNNVLGALQIPDNLGKGGLIKDPISGKAYPKTADYIQECIEKLEGHKKMSSESFNLIKFSQKKEHKEDKKKKDSRGNPFRVLMGKVGKLLDHGLERRDIARYLAKEHIWNEQTIEKAIKIVKQYNRKKKQKPKTSEAQTLPNINEKTERVYPDYKKRSTAELVTSICWLHTCATIDPNKVSFAKEVADRSGVKSMIREIKSELIRRGMAEKDLNSLLK